MNTHSYRSLGNIMGNIIPLVLYACINIWTEVVSLFYMNFVISRYMFRVEFICPLFNQLIKWSGLKNCHVWPFKLSGGPLSLVNLVLDVFSVV